MRRAPSSRKRVWQAAPRSTWPGQRHGGWPSPRHDNCSGAFRSRGDASWCGWASWAAACSSDPCPGAGDTRDFSTAPGENPVAGQPNCCPAQPLSTLLLSVAAAGSGPAVERWDAAWGQEGRLGATNRLTDWPFLAFPFLCAEALVVSLSQVMRAHTRGLFRWVHGVATRARDTTQPCTRWELVATS